MPRNPKILELDHLAERLAVLKAEGQRVVHSHGVFDLLHVGHIRHFELAKQMGDVLVVTLTRDEYVNKGPHRPAFPQDLRAEAVAALSMVDFVAINRWPLSVETIRLLKPDVYVKGSDYKRAEQDITGGIVPETDAIRSVGGEIRFTEDIVFSSSTLLNRHFSVFSPEVDAYLDEFRKRHSVDEILEWLGRAESLRPLVVGEAILDEYEFCEAIGKSTKDPVLAVLRRSQESCAGGSLAIANHLAGLCREVGLVSQLGEVDRHEEFIRSALRPNVRPTFLTRSGAPTIHKHRIVDRYSGSKLLEVYRMAEEAESPADRAALTAAIRGEVTGHDLTVVADYGHGLLDADSIALLCDTAPFLALNVQSNAGNRGFNPISKYHRADYICLAKHEMEVETRLRNEDAETLVREVARRISCPRFTVTLGKEGSLHYDAATGITRAPAVATRVLDRVGAGDAVLAVTSLLVKLGAPWDITAFVGNVAGAHLVAELGNRSPLERVSLSKHITTLLK
ncbi:MAG: PfkB family carbohydrate kinase [Candidatus Methylomirabilota bacterium]